MTGKEKVLEYLASLDEASLVKLIRNSSCVYNFGLFSFDRGNQIIGKDLFNHMNELVNKYHRVEWRMVGGNPGERHYDKFCEMHNGRKHILKDAVRDQEGNYRNDVIYEIVNRRNEKFIETDKEPTNLYALGMMDAYDDIINKSFNFEAERKVDS